jgi:hypothetical protein
MEPDYKLTAWEALTEAQRKEITDWLASVDGKEPESEEDFFDA